ncbi:hypothetical protein XENTR_v10001389 [Xenopus tropicalis]|nr:hypothetical protein XENTR_v10001389 [Xenopus tropicalis]
MKLLDQLLGSARIRMAILEAANSWINWDPHGYSSNKNLLDQRLGSAGIHMAILETANSWISWDPHGHF